MTDYSTLKTRIVSANMLDHAELITRAATQTQKVQSTAQWILKEFDAYYIESRGIPDLAKKAFEEQDPKTSLLLSKKRLSIYSESIHELGSRLKDVFPRVAENEDLWTKVETEYIPLIHGRYEADLAFAYINSVRRKIYQGEWKPVEYTFRAPIETTPDVSTGIYRVFPWAAQNHTETISQILAIPDFSASYRELSEDALLVAKRINHIICTRGEKPNTVKAIEMIDAGFYRNRGAYLVGRIILANAPMTPFVVALLNGGDGIYVDAVLSSEAHAHNIFSSTLANFHVTNSHYHELSAFLHSIMPTRPLGLHYSTIGFNHVGKVAVMNELKRELTKTNEVLQTAVGFRGTVAIGFSSPSSDYNLKIIRDKPTAQYKWGAFEGIDAVLRKYGRVHEINRTGSMLDNIIYYNLKLDKAWFDALLLEELLSEASQSVSLQGSAVILKYLIVQRRMTPLPVFLETASTADSETAIINLGYCIKNNAAANIFNKDLDARNYGVSRFMKVYLYDYDALEPFTQVKIRSNRDRVDGEEDAPDWYFEDGVIFLPEEIEVGLRIPSRLLRRLFRDVHGELLSTEYWERVQHDLRAGRVPSIRTYPQSQELRRVSHS